MAWAGGRAEPATKAISMNDMNEDGDKQLGSPAEPEAGAGDVRANLLARRRLLIGAGAAAPVVLTMASMPAHANGACINPSGFISAATYASRHPSGNPAPCTTQGPNFWLRDFDNGKVNWPTAMPNTRQSKFSAIFGGTALQGDPKLWEVLKGKSVVGQPVVVYSDFAKYCVAAYLNSRTLGGSFPLSTNQARGLYSAIKLGSVPTGSSNPIPVTNPAWDEARAMVWLQMVMG